MTIVPQQTKASRLRDLHHGTGLLILPNAWDAASARVFEAAGFPAIATTSSGIAYSLAELDGERIGRERMLARVAEIAAAVSIPVSADMETGYSGSPEEVAETARLVVEAGAVGINLEDGLLTGDGLVAAEVHAGRIRAARKAAPFLVVNARTDLYLRRMGEAGERYSETVRRARVYLEAGADCIFVPGVDDADTISRLVREIPGPVNILAWPGTPSPGELERLGVRRVTFGSGPMRAAMGLVRRIAAEVLEQRSYGALFEGAIAPKEMAEIMRSKGA
jgi:2-methylisocitrate lyase-like PEP mutase family enzyme